MSVHAVIFDLDGLLMETELLWREAIDIVLSDNSITIPVPALRSSMGMRIDEAVSSWHTTAPWTEISQPELVDQIFKELDGLVTQKAKPMPGVNSIFGLVRELGLKSALASNSPKFVVESELKKLDVKHNLDLIVSGMEVERGKPDPAIYLKTADELMVEPINCIVFEDSINGMRAALAAEMKCIAIPNPMIGDKSGFKDADASFESLRDVTKEVIYKIINV